MNLYSFSTTILRSINENPNGKIKASFFNVNFSKKIMLRKYFVVFVLMAQFVLVNVVVAVLMKKLDVNMKKIIKENLEQTKFTNIHI